LFINKYTIIEMNTESENIEELSTVSSEIDISSNDDTNVETWLDALDEKEIEDLEETVLEMIEEYLYGQIVKMSDPKFSALLCDDIATYLFGVWNDANICDDTDEDYKEAVKFVYSSYDKYMDEYSMIPPRQCAIDDERADVVGLDISASLSRISRVLQIKQRTREWYEKRYNMITASNISKALGSEAQRNSLIYEKCKPLVLENQYGNVNTENSMHWGVKYEPITAAIYEDMFSAKLSDFGCIPHEKYPFIGASPDGIVTDPSHPRYGHMVEIKNIVNRDITGIPKEEYWIQMQVQLETCDLEYCDFIETRIKEYVSYDEYCADSERQYKGVVLYFVKKMLVAGALPDGDDSDNGKYNVPHYEYMPLHIPNEEIDQWIHNKKTELREEYVLYKTDYWYLDTISCVLVQRNREWFHAAVPSFVSIWETIEKERISGYTHRAAVKRQKPFVVIQTGCERTPELGTSDGSVSSENQTVRNISVSTGVGICLVKLDEAGNNIRSYSL